MEQQMPEPATIIHKISEAWRQEEISPVVIETTVEHWDLLPFSLCTVIETEARRRGLWETLLRLRAANPESSPVAHAGTTEGETRQHLEWLLLWVLVIVLMLTILLSFFKTGSAEPLSTSSKEDTPVLISHYEKLDREGERGQFLKQQEQQQIEKWDMELKNIDKYAVEERQKIENWYLNNLIILQEWAQEMLERLDDEEKLAWGRFCQNMQNITSHRSGYLIGNSYGSADSHATAGGYAITHGYTWTDGYFSGTTHTFVVGNPGGRYESEIRQIRNSKEAIRSEFENLKRKKEGHLAELEQYVNNLRENVYAAKRRLKESTEIKLQGGPGLISAICSSKNGQSSIVFEGQILHEGHIANGFKVHKIHPDRVEFEKDGKIWVQKLRGTSGYYIK